MSWRRKGLTVAAIGAAWLLTLSVLAWRHAPWGLAEPTESRMATPDAWTAVSGKINAGDNLSIDAFDASGAALVVWQPQPFDAAALPVLRLTLEDLPFNYVVMFAWTRTGDEPEFTRLQTAGGDQTYLLSRFEGWRGEIREIALFMHPQQQNLPPIPAAAQPSLQRLGFESDRLSARLAAMATAWFAPDPWEMLSVSSLGIHRDTEEGVRLTPLVALLALMAWLITGLVCPARTDWGRWQQLGLRYAIAGALAIWAVWMVGLVQQHVATRAHFGDLTAEQQQDALFDADLVRFVREAKAVLPAPGEARIFVVTDDRFISLRAAWHLRPHNVSTRRPRANDIADGDYVFYYRRNGLDTEVARSRLTLANTQYRVQRLTGGSNGAGLVRIVSGGRS